MEAPMTQRAEGQMGDPNAACERQLIDQYLLKLKQDPLEVRRRTDATAQQLLRDASLHASGQLATTELRKHPDHSHLGASLRR
ncbi:MAG: hypothetical protein KW802_01090 [Candidatus Doudnabacteria bacterium]|nr:hypothetical protein [Candidatus Doudnabacteria bacterium]